MAISNKLGPMVLTTGNKSEVSVGYATLYGDMNGGFNPIKDLYKGQVYALSRYRNAHRPKDLPRAGRAHHSGERARPRSRPPSSSPASATRTRCRLIPCWTTFSIAWSSWRCRCRRSSRGATRRRLVKKVERMLYLAEYKRRQAAPGVKITAKNFGRDRRYPITNKFRERP